MSYEVRITRKAFRDMQDAADYIEFEKYNPDAADNLLDTAAEMIGSLSEYPERYLLSEDAILRSWGIRHFPVKNYLVFYTVVENTVYVVRFLHQRRDWISILHQEGIDYKGE